jgi:2'-5' RNA ligase
MSAPVIDPEASTEGIPENAVAIRLPVMVVEGIETSDGRFIDPGSLETRDLPIPLYAATRTTHGNEGDAATWHVGAITSAKRVPGNEAKGYSGKALADDVFVWEGTGWMYTDVPAAPDKSAYQLVKDGALRGNSVDLSGIEVEFQGADGELVDPNGAHLMVMRKGSIAATTLVGIPAFADAYIELDGTAMEPAAVDATLTAAAAPMWQASEIGDECSPCQAGEELAPAVEAFALGEDFDPPKPDYSTSGMVALLPSNPNMLLVPGGDPAGELHLTLAYLGDRVDEWTAEQAAAVHEVARKLTDVGYAEEVRRAAAAERGEPLDDSMSPYVSEAQKGPLDATIFAHAVFNPNDKPATVYLLDGTGDRPAIEFLASCVQNDVGNMVGDVLFPQQHYPFVPHVTAGYGLDPSQLTYTGPVTFDRIRVAIGDDVTDYPLGGGQIALVASAATLPPVSWFQDPKLTGPTALTVDDDGRVYGHLATWGTCHTGFAGQCVLAPRSATDYAYYQVHATRAQDADGKPVNVPVGYGTLSSKPGVGGHAGGHLSASETAAHYDNTCTAVFELACGEDEHGIWVSGQMMPGLDEDTAHKARGAALSGDWRNIRGNLELVAALGVVSPGFPVPRARVASGTPMSLVAAGVIATPTGGVEDGPRTGQVLPVSDEEFRTVIAWINDQRLTAEQAAALAELDDLAPDMELLAAEAQADLLLALDADHPWFAEDVEIVDDSDGQGTGDAVLTAAGKKVLHLPPYIKRISKHLRSKGMAEGRAIATAVNAAKKMCATGDLNFPGSQQVNPGSKAQACAAVAQWKKDRPGAR